MSKKPTDPLNTSKEYTYSTITYGAAYQLETDYEGDGISYEESNHGLLSFVPEAFAATGNPLIAYIKGNYSGIAAKTQT